MQFHDRLNSLLTKRDITPYRVYKDTGISKQTVLNWTSGRSVPNGNKLQQLADYLGVTTDYLLNGENPAASAITALRGVGLDAMPLGDNMRRVPVIGTVKAGFGGLAEEDPDGYEFVSVPSGGEYFFLRVSGDSMTPDIRPGDLALVHMQDDVDSGQLAVVIYDGEEGMLKRVVKAGEDVILYSFNTAYAPRVIHGADCADLRIIGRVVETKHSW